MHHASHDLKGLKVTAIHQKNSTMPPLACKNSTMPPLAHKNSYHACPGMQELCHACPGTQTTTTKTCSLHLQSILWNAQGHSMSTSSVLSARNTAISCNGSKSTCNYGMERNLASANANVQTYLLLCTSEKVLNQNRLFQKQSYHLPPTWWL